MDLYIKISSLFCFFLDATGKCHGDMLRIPPKKKNVKEWLNVLKKSDKRINQPIHFKIVQDCSRLFKTVQDCSRLSIDNKYKYICI